MFRDNMAVELKFIFNKLCDNYLELMKYFLAESRMCRKKKKPSFLNFFLEYISSCQPPLYNAVVLLLRYWSIYQHEWALNSEQSVLIDHHIISGCHYSTHTSL